jgi:hypothetical protein
MRAVKLFGFGYVLVAASLAIGVPALAQPPPQNPTQPAPPSPSPLPPGSPTPPDSSGSNAPPSNAPPPNPDAPPPGTEKAPTPATTIAPPAEPTTPSPPAPPAVDKQAERRTALERQLAAQAKCDAHDSSCDWLATFSSLERLSIHRSLAALGLEIEPAPWGKTVGRIVVNNEDVFAERNWLRFFNVFHITTRAHSIRNELTIDEGQAWDDELIAESARRLKDPLFTGVVALLPVRSVEPGKVDLLVVTRDIWSLRLNTRYGIQAGTLTDLSISLSENNFLGLRKTVALGLLVDQASIATGPLYIDKNFLGRHMDFRFRIDKIFTRQSLPIVLQDGNVIPTGDPGGLQDDGVFHSEGSQATVALTKTLWSLASEWGGGASFTYRNAINRSYFGTGLRAVPVENTATGEMDILPYEYRMRSWSVGVSATRQWGGRYKSQLETGYSVSSQTPSILSGFPTDPQLRASFADQVFPRTELVSSPYLEYSFFRATFRTIRNVDTFDLAEDLRTGPNATVGLQQSLKVFGADYNFTRPSLTLGWTFPWTSDGFVRLSAGGQMRIQGGSAIDNTATAQVRVATPTLKYARLVAQVHTETRWHDTQNAFYTLGSESGLRAYDIGEFIGDRRLVGQFEVRSIPVPFWVLRLGAVAFFEFGDAAASFNEMKIHSDAGVGFRMLIPQTARDLFRFDFAKPFDAGQRCPLPGNICFIAAFDSYF